MNMEMIPTKSLASKVRVTIPFKARSVETGGSALFPKGTVLWHVEKREERVRFQEIGGKNTYETWEDEFETCVRNISR
jgi:hypothetical protein